MAPTNGSYDTNLETDGCFESVGIVRQGTIGVCNKSLSPATEIHGTTTKGCIVASPTEDDSTFRSVFSNANMNSGVQTVDSSTGLDFTELKFELNNIADKLYEHPKKLKKRAKSTAENAVSRDYNLNRAYNLNKQYRRITKTGRINKDEIKILTEMVQVIFALEAENEFIFLQDCDGDTKLHLVTIFKLEDIAITIIDSMSDYSVLDIQNRLFQTPLILAVLLDMPRLARRLMSCGVEIDARDYNGNTALHIACRDGNVQMAESLMTPIRHEEVAKNRSEISYRRIPQDLSIMNFEGVTCIELAFISKDIQLMDILLHKGADVDQRCLKSGRTLLYRACLTGDIDIVNNLISKQCNINMCAYDGSTPFDAARASRYWQIAVVLAERGAESDSDEDI